MERKMNGIDGPGAASGDFMAWCRRTCANGCSIRNSIDKGQWLYTIEDLMEKCIYQRQWRKEIEEREEIISSQKS